MITYFNWLRVFAASGSQPTSISFSITLAVEGSALSPNILMFFAALKSLS